MHPHLLTIHAVHREHQRRLAAAARRHRTPKRVRRPSRWRWVAAVLLARAAADLTDEPVVVLPRRA